MPEAPMPEGGPAQPAEAGGVEEAIAQTGTNLAKFSQLPDLPDNARAAAQAALEAFQAFADALSGGGEAPAEPGVVTPEQGGSNAQPLGMGRPR